MNERGLALVEVMVSTALVAIILGVLTTIVYRTGQGVDGNNSQITVFRSIEDAASFIGGDVNMAKYTSLSADNATATTATFEWTDFYEDQNFGHRSIYSLSGTDLYRDYDGVIKVVAKNFSALTFSRGTVAQGKDRLITVTITVTATEGPKQFGETKTFRFKLRPET